MHMSEYLQSSDLPGWAGPSDELEHVELVLPVRPELWALARITASAIAARLDFSVDQLEDLRLSIDELCTSCAVQASARSRLHLDYRSDEGSVSVVCSVFPVLDARNEEDLQSLELSARILEALVDEHAIEEVKEGRRRGWLVMRRDSRS